MVKLKHRDESGDYCMQYFLAGVVKDRENYMEAFLANYTFLIDLSKTELIDLSKTELIDYIYFHRSCYN